jgi:hypothetical protein
MLDATSTDALQDYSEVTSTGHRDHDRLQQMLREKQWVNAEHAAEELGKRFIRLAIWCRDRQEAEQQLARMSIGQELMRHLNGMDAR